MQNVLPVSGQSSRLFVTVSGGKITLLFVFVDYDSNTSSSKYTVLPLPSDFSLEVLDDILRDILLTWGSDNGLDLRSDASEIVYAIFYDSRQVGGTDLIMSSQYYQEGFRSNILGCSAQVYDDKKRLDSAIKYMRSFNSSDVLWVNLDWDKITVYSVSRIGLKDSLDVDLREYSITNDVSKKAVLNQVENVVGVHIESENIRNILANIITKQITTSSSTEVWDLLRSFITANLIKIKDPHFKSFGMKTSDAHLVVTGDMCSVPSLETLFISVIDGLRLRGRYKVVIDRELRSIVAGVVLGSKSFICPLKELYKNRFVYFSSETESRARSGEESFSGTVESTDSSERVGVKSIMGQVGQFYTLDLNGTGRIIIKPGRSSYFPNLVREGDNLIGSFSTGDRKAVIDCRRLPIVYGPDENANAERIKGWINGLKLKDLE